MKTKFAFLRSRGVALKTAVVSMAVAASSAHADATLPTWATSMISDAGTQVGLVLAAVGTVIGTTLAGFLVIKLVKRGVNKI